MSVKCLSAILGPEMGASILWAPGKLRSFCRKKTHVHKIPRFRGGGILGFFGGGSAGFIFMGARIFLIIASDHRSGSLVAHPCGDPNRATQCRAYSVASNSRRITDYQRCRPTIALHPPKSRSRTFLRTPPVAAGRGPRGGCRGGLVEGIAALLGSEKGSRYRGVSQLQSQQSR